MASASVTVDSQLISSIGKGVLVFAGVSEKDSRKEVEAMASKVLKMKMWPDENGGTVGLEWCSISCQTSPYTKKWKKSVQDIQGEVLCGKYSVISTPPKAVLIRLKYRNSPSKHPPRKATSQTSTAQLEVKRLANCTIASTQK